jgi:hypothetical protein
MASMNSANAASVSSYQTAGAHCADVEKSQTIVCLVDPGMPKSRPQQPLNVCSCSEVRGGVSNSMPILHLFTNATGGTV